jgi:YesN/AraC family two-component response regulator
MKIRFKNKKSIFKTWLFSYILMMFMPVLLSILLSTFSNKVLEDQIRNNNEVSMNYLKQAMDNNLSSLKKVLINVAWDLNVSQFLIEKPPLNPEKRVEIVNVIKSLNQSSTLSNLTDLLYVYFNNSNLIVSSTGSSTAIEMYELNHKFENFTYNNLLESLRDESKNGYHLVPYFDTSGRKKNGLMLTYSLPIGSRKQVLGTIAVICDRDILANIMQKMSYAEQTQVYIVDNQNRLVTSTTGTEFPEGFNLSLLKNSSGNLFIPINDEEYSVAYISSDVMEWKYVSIIPKSLFQKKLNNIRFFSAFGLSLCILFGCICAYALSKANYKKVRALTNKIEEGVFPESFSGNELDLIGHYIELTEEYKKEISRKLKNHNEELKEKYCRDLLYGIMQEKANATKILERCGIIFNSDIFAVMIIPQETISSSQEKSISVYKKVIENVIEQKSDDKVMFFGCQIDNKIAYILNIFADSPKKTVEAAIEQIYDVIVQKFHIQFTVAVSDIHEGQFGITTAFKEAQEMLEYQEVSGRSGVLFYSYIKAAPSKYQDILPLEMQQRIINCIKGMDIKRAKEIMNDAIEKLRNESAISLGMGKCVMFSMMNTITQALHELSNALGHNLLDFDEFVERLLKCQNILEIKYVLDDIFKIIENELTQIGEIEKNKFIEKIKEYVNQNHMKYSLNISNVAEYIKMNPTYLSRRFKEQTGENLLDYINRIRIANAKNLLINPKLSVNRIAQLVGYVNGNAFIRSFKRYEGITPGNYRKTNDVGDI